MPNFPIQCRLAANYLASTRLGKLRRVWGDSLLPRGTGNL